MERSRSLERLIYFTDAVVAIAITVMILPLVDRVTDLADSGGAPSSYLEQHGGLVASFLISFAVIARLWMLHHSLFGHIAQLGPRLFALNLFWAFTIVLLPLPTVIVSEFPPSTFTVLFYIGTMAVSSLTLALLVFFVRRTPGLEDSTNPFPRQPMLMTFTMPTLFLAALVVGTVFPAQINYLALLLLLLTWPINALISRSAHGSRAQREGTR